MFKRETGRAGFTLIEIIIAIAISSIVVMASSRLLISVLNQYNSNNDDINLQTEVEEILNLMENVIMEADSVTILDDVDGTVASGSSGSVLRVDQSEEDSSGNTVYYYYLLFQDGYNAYESVYSSDDKETWSQTGSRKKIYLGTHVADDGLLFTLTDSETAVFVDMSMENGSATYDASRKILLRNLTNGYKSDDSETTTTTSSTTAATTTAATTTTAVETTAAEPKDNDISVTSSAITMSSDNKYYDISITLKNNGNPVSWNDIALDYYVNYPERYDFVAVLSSFTCPESSSVDCAVEHEDLSTTYTNAVGKLSISFTENEEASFGYGEEAVIKIMVGNKKSDGTWGSLYESTNNASHRLDTSYSAQNKSNVVLYIDGSIISGTAPTETASVPTYVDIDISDFTVDKSDSTQYTISFNVKNCGMDIAWSDLDLRFYYITPEGKTLDYTLDSCSSDEISTVVLSCVSEELSGTYSNATDYLKFTIADAAGDNKADGKTGTFYRDEAVSVSFIVKYDDGTSLETAGSLWSFTNSHSLLSGSTGNYIGIYYENTLLSSSYNSYNAYIAPETIDTDSVKMQVSGATYKYNSAGTECTVSFTAQNLGKDVDWSDVTLQYYIMIPSTQNDYLYIKDCSYTLNGDSSADLGTLKVSQTKRDTALEGSTHYITVGFDSTSAEFETYDSVAFTFTVYYSDGTELETKSSSYGFQNSYSLDGDSYITIYYSGSGSNPVWGTAPKDEAEDEDLKVKNDEIKLIVSSEEYTYDSNTLTEYVQLTSNGTESIDLEYVQVRFFFYLSDGAKFEQVSFSDITVNGSTDWSYYYLYDFADVYMDTALESASGYIKVAWNSTWYLAGGNSVGFTITAKKWNPALSTCSIDASFSLDYGVAVYYKGELIYGYEPDDVADAYGKDDGFDDYEVKPDTFTVTWNSWNVNSNTTYDSTSGTLSSYDFTMYCNNLSELEADKFEIRLYQYYGQEITTGNFTVTSASLSNTTGSIDTSLCEVDANGNYYFKLSGISFDSASSYVSLSTFMRNITDTTSALKDGCYCPDGTYPIEVYYNNTRIWPTTSASAGAGSGDSGSTNTEPEEDDSGTTTTVLKTWSSDDNSSQVGYSLDLSDLTTAQIESVAKIVAEVTVDSGYCNGAIGMNGYDNGTWQQGSMYEISSTGTIEWDLTASGITTGLVSNYGYWSPNCQVQVWYISAINDSTAGTATLTSVTLYDSSGNVIKKYEP